MKSPLYYFKKSLSTKLSLWIVIFTAVILVTALGYMFMFVYSRRILENNPDLNGCSIAFEPGFFKQKGRYFSAFSLRDNGEILTTQEGNEHYEYFYMDWYQLCKLLDRPVWTEPFIDYNPENIYSKDMIASYCKPIKDKNGKYVGTISVDLSLTWLSNTISAVKPYPNSYSIMTGRGGTFFVHPDSTKLFYQTIFTETLEHEDTALTALGHAMQCGEEGMRQLLIDGQECYVFYKPLGTTGWSVAIVCPESDIFGSFNRLRRAVTIAVLAGLLFLLLVSIRIITRELKPLRQLADQARIIAKGNFDETLPESKRVDEIGQLSQSFSDMQRSLAGYIEELKQTTAQKASIENELKVASDIQMSMVPRIFPAFPNRPDIDLYASMTPAKEVGGDLYDFFVQDEHLYFCVGDVSGKGIPASLFMAVTRNLFRIVAQQGLPPAEIASQINNILAVDNDRGMFVTMFIGKADLRTGHLDYCNCGHNAPVVDGQLLEMQYANQPLGLWEDDPFYGESIENIKGKQFLLYTDGLNEAENPEKELLGNDRLIALMQDAQDMSARQVVDMLKAAVEEHRAGADPNDDLTLLCLTIKG